MSLRLKLLLLGLATLVLPWGGCQYAREMESALREGEENSLQAVSQTVAASLQGRTDLLYREAPPPADAPDAPPDETSGHAFLQSGPYDLKPLALTAAPLLDGYSDDWPHDPSAWAYFARDDRHRFGILTGVYERMLYVLLEVRDEHPLFDAPGTNPLDPGTFGARVWLGFEDSQGEERQVFLAATAPGAVTARRIETGEYGQQSAPLEPRIRGAWQPMSHGYRIELRAPLSMLGHGFGVLVDDRDARGADPVSYGTLRSDDLHTLGRLIVAAPELTSYLAQFMQPGLKLAVSTPSGRVLARADALARLTGLGTETPILARLYRRFVDRPGTRALLESSAPIYDRDHKTVIGELEVTQTANRWIRLRDHALMRMLNFSLSTSAVAVTLMFAFAAWLSLRLSRLRQGSERLNAILIAMGAATRVEEAIGGAERMSFDLAPLLESAVAAYRGAFPERTFRAELPTEPVAVRGAPDLIVQMLDKLIDNAVDFSPAGALISVRLRLDAQAALIEVDNPGPALAAHVQGRLFESLWQSRAGPDSRPHFGLGLYIVRLIAEFHGGEATALNLPDGSGARILVRLAR